MVDSILDLVVLTVWLYAYMARCGDHLGAAVQGLDSMDEKDAVGMTLDRNSEMEGADLKRSSHAQGQTAALHGSYSPSIQTVRVVVGVSVEHDMGDCECGSPVVDCHRP